MRSITMVTAAVLAAGAAMAAPAVWLNYTDVPEQLMVSSDSGLEVKGCLVEWQVRYDNGLHYTEVALVDLPAKGEVKVADCGDWWDENRSKSLDVRLKLLDPKGVVLAEKAYEGVFRVLPRQGLPTAGWSATASRGNAAAALDGDPGTRWDTGGRQEVGDWYALRMHQVVRIRGLILDARRSSQDYPSGLTVEVTTNGEDWTRIVDLQDTEPVNKRGRLSLSFDPVDAWKVRVTLTKAHGESWFWSIHELSVLGEDGQ
jgi:hypothetical protein